MLQILTKYYFEILRKWLSMLYPQRSIREGGCCSSVCSILSSGDTSASSPDDGVDVLGDSCGFTCILKIKFCNSNILNFIISHTKKYH